jgi:hypothetical protein
MLPWARLRSRENTVAFALRSNSASEYRAIRDVLELIIVEYYQ